MARYDFHGVGLAVVDRSRACSAAIDRRLTTFSSSGGRDPELLFEYDWASESSKEVPRPTGAGRPVYDTDLGEVLYHTSDDVLWATTHDGAWLRCDCAAGAVSTSLGSAERPDADWLGSRPFFTLPLVELLKRHGLFCVHAAGLVSQGRAVVVAGPSGSGKTTLAIALLRAGFGLLSDDMVFLRRSEDGLVVLSFPDELDVTDATAAMFPELSALAGRPLEAGWSKHRIRAEEAFELQIVDEARPGVVVVPERAPGASSGLAPLEPDRALVELAPNVLLTEPASAKRHVDALAELVRASACYRLRIGDDLDAIPALLADTVAGGTP